MDINLIREKLMWLGMLSLDTNKPLTYSGFKNRASVIRYGPKNKIVFIGQPKNNLFAFYTVPDTDVNTMREAYLMYAELVKGDMDYFNAGRVQWGNKGLPLTYADLRTK